MMGAAKADLDRIAAALVCDVLTASVRDRLWPRPLPFAFTVPPSQIDRAAADHVHSKIVLGGLSATVWRQFDGALRAGIAVDDRAALTARLDDEEEVHNAIRWAASKLPAALH